LRITKDLLRIQRTYAPLLTRDIAELLRRNRSRRKQVGEIIETHTAFFGRYYTSDTYNNGRRKAKTVKLADKSDIYRSKGDVQHLLNRLMEAVNTGKEFPSAQLSLTDFIGKHYLPWCRTRRSPPPL
jgi:hypothetical protein